MFWISIWWVMMDGEEWELLWIPVVGDSHHEWLDLFVAVTHEPIRQRVIKGRMTYQGILWMDRNQIKSWIGHWQGPSMGPKHDILVRGIHGFVGGQIVSGCGCSFSSHFASAKSSTNHQSNHERYYQPVSLNHESVWHGLIFPCLCLRWGPFWSSLGSAEENVPLRKPPPSW